MSDVNKRNNNKLLILSGINVDDIQYKDNGNDDTVDQRNNIPIIDPYDIIKDNMDLYNHPRKRRALILTELKKKKMTNTDDSCLLIKFDHHPITSITTSTVDSSSSSVTVVDTSTTTIIYNVYKNVHSIGLIQFLITAWDQWIAIGDIGRHSSACLPKPFSNGHIIPPLVSICSPLRGGTDDIQEQIPSLNVIGQNSYYNTDTTTPIFNGLLDELINDAILVKTAVDFVTTDTNGDSNDNDNDDVTSTNCCYIITSHPGHHSSYDCFGGYCYLNHAAACADLLKQHFNNTSNTNNTNTTARIAVLDVDYHCGNGTASIFYNDPNVLVISIHCHPNYDYPFHTGFDTQCGSGLGIGTTIHLPLQPGTNWNDQYKSTLEYAMVQISNFTPNALIVSLGLDTYTNDPCAIAGFDLHDDDYVAMGQTIQNGLPTIIPTIFIQEGGYRMDKVGQAAADVVFSFISN